jgi:DNA-binding LacI/PurR family transcriptional regulator
VRSNNGHVAKRAGVAAAAVALMVALGACGSSDNGGANNASADAGSNGGSQQLAAEMKKLEVRPTKIGITDPIKDGVPNGKRVVFLQCAFPDCAQTGNAVQTAATKVGWSLTRIPIGTSPEKIAAAWRAALQKNPDAIINSGAYPQAFYKRYLDEAVARKLPLVAFAEAHQGDPWTLVVGSGDGVGTATADIAAKYVASKISGGSVMAITIPGIGVIESEVAAFKQRLPQYCPKCTVDTLEVPPASIGTDAGKRIASYLQSHRDTKFGFLSVIDLVIGLKAALAAAGVKPVPLIGQSTSGVGLDAINNHDAGIEATTAYPAFDGAYRAIDALARTFRGQSVKPDEDATFTHWLITKNNVTKERPLPAVKDYAQQFEALWGLK